MIQNQVSTSGGRESIVTNSSPITGTYLSEQYTNARRLNPIPTEWRVGGRPIYGRLPAASERYKLDFSFDDSSAYPYIPVGEGYTGVTSMAVATSGDNKFLFIQAGNIAWKYGTIKTTPVILDLELIGMGSARYLLAYQLYYDDSPKPQQYSVTDLSLAGMRMQVDSGTDSVQGWRYSTKYAFLNKSERFWSNRDGLFPSYNQDAYLSWQTPLANSFSSITLRCPKGTNYKGTATIYYMSCSEVTDQEFCQSPVWNFWGTSEVSEDGLGQFYSFSFDTPIACKGWKVEWSDPQISIKDIIVSGTITESKKPATMTTGYALVAYPVNAIPDKFINSEGEEVPLIMCKLAYVDIDSTYTVLDVQDIREVVYTKYEPISEWLTRSWDETLMNLFEQVSYFPEKWMNPDTCAKSEYDKLSGYGITVEQNQCPQPDYQTN